MNTARMAVLKNLLKMCHGMMAEGHGDDEEKAEEALAHMGDDEPKVAEAAAEPDDDEEEMKALKREHFKGKKPVPKRKSVAVMMQVGRAAPGKGLKRYG